MATTVEEILVKFTGDAKSFTNASDKARGKTKQLQDDVLRLNRMLENAQKTNSVPKAQAEAMERLEKATRKYADALEKARRQEERQSGGGRGGRDNAVERGVGSFISAARRHIAFQTIHASEDLLLKVIQDWQGWTDAIRDNNKAQYEATQVQRHRVQLVADQQAQVEREVGMLKNPFTGENDIEAERARRTKALRELEEQQKQSNLTKARLEREIKQVDQGGAEGNDMPGGSWLRRRFTKGQIAKVPIVGEAEKIEIDAANKALEEQREKHEAINAAIHKQRESLKDLDKLGSPLEREERRLQILNHSVEVQNRAIGKTGEQAALDEDRARVAQAALKDAKADADLAAKVNGLLEQRAALLQENEAKQRAQAKSAKEVAEREQMDERLRRQQFAGAGRGFRGVEAEVLARNAEGKQRGNAELLANAYADEGAALNQRFLPAAMKAQLEIERLDMLLAKGAITAETHARAMGEVARGIDRTGRAASRAATTSGSAEHYSRIDDYARTMSQPSADSAALDRARREAKDNPTVKAIQDGNSILRRIEKGQAKEGVTLKPLGVD